MFDRPTFQFAVEHARAFKEIGQTDVWLDRSDDFPWPIAESCEPGGSHRMDIATSVRFGGNHPCGLHFSWMFDIEGPNANGSSEYQIETGKILAILPLLTPAVAGKFREYLRDCAEKVEKRGEEYMEAARRQYGTAAALKGVSA